MRSRLASLASRWRATQTQIRSSWERQRAELGVAHAVLLGALTLVGASAAMPGGGAVVAMTRLVLVLVGGALAAWVWPKLPIGLRKVLDLCGQIAAPLVVARLGYDLYEVPIFDEKRGVVLDDWAPHHVQVSIVAEAMRHHRVAHWTHLLFAGEPIGDLYPAFGTYVAAWVTNARHLEDAVPRALAIVGATGVVGMAVGVVLVAQRVVRWPLALAAGLLALFDDGGAISSGSGGVFVLALYQHALAQALSLVAIAAALWSVQRPAAWRSLLVWATAALAMVAHPLSLISLLPFVVGFAAAPLVATDVRFTRAWRGARDLLVGMLLAAPVWMPLLENVLRYGLHYGSAPITPIELGTAIVAGRYGVSTFPLAVTLGLAGLVAGLWSRQVLAVTLAIAALIAMLLGTDFPFLAAGFSPSPSVTRFAAERTQGILRLTLLVLAALAIDRALLTGARSIVTRPHAAGRIRAVLGAFAVALLLVVTQMAYPFVRDRTRLQRDAAELDVADPPDFRLVVDWLKAHRTPGHGLQRVYFEETHAYPFHAAALARVPVIRTGYAAGTMLRERIDAPTPAMLARYNVAWVVRRGGAPSFGDPRTEQRYGQYRIRALPTHDGRVARIARGSGAVRVLRFDDARVELELSGTTQPALVELGISYYPRWRARQRGRDVPVYATLAEAGHVPRVLALWLRPGRTVLTPDGPLPTDHLGDLPMAAALFVAALVFLFALWPRARWRSLRVAARVLRMARRRRGPIFAAFAAIAAIVLAAAAVRSSGAEVLALVPTRVLAADAQVRFLPDGEAPRRCPFRWQSGYFECGIEFGRVGAGHLSSVNDKTASWPFVAPAIRMFPSAKLGIYEIRMQRRASGTWLAASWGPLQDVRLTIDDRTPLNLDLSTRLIELGDFAAPHDFLLTARVSGAGRFGGVSVVARRALDVDRDNDVPWVPSTAPPP